MDFEDYKIQLFPGDTVKKFGIVTRHISGIGLIIRITSIDKEFYSGFTSTYEVGTEYFIPWNKLIFAIIEKPEPRY